MKGCQECLSKVGIRCSLQQHESPEALEVIPWVRRAIIRLRRRHLKFYKFGVRRICIERANRDETIRSANGSTAFPYKSYNSRMISSICQSKEHAQWWEADAWRRQDDFWGKESSPDRGIWDHPSFVRLGWSSLQKPPINLFIFWSPSCWWPSSPRMDVLVLRDGFHPPKGSIIKF